MSDAQQRLAKLRQSIGEVSVEEALKIQNETGALIVDVRSREELAKGSPVGAIALGRDFLEFEVTKLIPKRDTPILMLCGIGGRALFCAESLQNLGYSQVRSIKGGYTAWQEKNLPTQIPRMLDAKAKDRYSRQLKLPEVDEKGQLRLLDSKVLLIGAGGLGSPIALYLAGAGVGTIGIVDHDVVERHNLQRQIVHTDDREGTLKVESAALTLNALNPDINIIQHNVYLTSDNIEAIFADYEIIVDGTDNFPTRYLVNDACVKLKRPNVYGSVLHFDGQVSVFWPGKDKDPGPCYRCLYPLPPPAEMAPSCADAGVLGVVPGVIGLLQATEVIKLLLEIGDPLVGRLLCYDALDATFTEYKVASNPNCPVCAKDTPFPGYIDYVKFCANE